MRSKTSFACGGLLESRSKSHSSTIQRKTLLGTSLMKLTATSLFLLTFICLQTVLGPVCCLAEPSAQEIAQRVFDRNDGTDSVSEVTMTLTPDGGSPRERRMEVSAKDYGELTKRLIVFTSPKSIKDTSFLTWEQFEDRDTQFLYLPALRRVRRIASDQKDRSFVNSDFSYEDLERRKVELDTYKLLGTDTIINRPVWKLVRTPKEKSSSQYSKSEMWVDKESFLVLRADMYNSKGELFKKLTVQNIKKIDGIWTAMEVRMHDAEREHTTTNVIQSIAYNKGISDEVFTKSHMERR